MIGNTTLGSSLGVTGATTLRSTLLVAGATTLSSTLAVSGNTRLAQSLRVDGPASVNGLTVSAGGINNNNGGITNAGAIGGVTDLNMTGAYVRALVMGGHTNT